MALSEALKMSLARYASFGGRARRSEYWSFTLFHSLAVLLAMFVSYLVMLTNPALAIILYSFVIFGTLLPHLAVSVRRLHDINRSGWWYLFGLVPLLGTIALLVLLCTDGTRGPNRFGADSKATVSEAVKILRRNRAGRAMSNRVAFFLMAAALCGATAAPASAAPSTSPGYTAADQAAFAKLDAGLGTWTCVDTPPDKSPDVMTVTQQGNFYVLRETGDDPSTSYIRWSHGLQNYFATVIADSGLVLISYTASADPYNGTWNVVFPPAAMAGPIPPYTLSLTGKTFTESGQYPDPKTKASVPFKSVCTKS
jgi:uncharacterized membrane protein YhaH (DUF805 family)